MKIFEVFSWYQTYQILRDAIYILGSKQNSQAWLGLRDSTGQPT